MPIESEWKRTSTHRRPRSHNIQSNLAAPISTTHIIIVVVVSCETAPRQRRKMLCSAIKKTGHAESLSKRQRRRRRGRTVFQRSGSTGYVTIFMAKTFGTFRGRTGGGTDLGGWVVGIMDSPLPPSDAAATPCHTSQPNFWWARQRGQRTRFGRMV